jgi:F-type H+-transporting ATPase subunit delta
MNKAARRYTAALYAVAKERKLLDRTGKDFEFIKGAVERSRELRIFLQSPIINPVKKQNIIKKLFARRVQALTMKFIEMVCQMKRENLLYDISSDYIELLNEKRGIAEADIRTVIEIPEKDKKALVDRLKKYTGKDIKAVFKIDKDIKGGFVAQVKDTIIDASIKRQLELLKERLKIKD